MYYQWDALLLESTVYVAILAWFDNGPADSIALFGIVSLLLRVVFMNGATKLLSKCPTWWNLTALNYHFESQPLPTPFAWYAHYFPQFFKQLATLQMNFIEILLPPLFLIPLIHVRYFVFFCQVLLTTLTLFTGNNGFFNYNILVLMVSLLQTPRVPIGASFLAAIVFAKIGFEVVYRLPYKILFEDDRLPSFALTLTHESFRKFMIYYIDVIVATMAIIFTIVNCYSMLKVGSSQNGRMKKWVHLAFVLCSVLFLGVYGNIPLLRMDEKLAQRTYEPPVVMTMYKTVNSWSVANSYGSYRQMTGTHGRPEIVIEGSHHIEGPWREIEFTSKPGKVSKRPRFISPHHPRLDMQMYYAAEGTYQQNPFFLSLVYHLMQNTTEVVNLIEDYPFKNRSEPMRFARAKLYMYHFTDIGDKNWWTRSFQEEYMPTFNKGNDALLNYLTEHKIINKRKSEFVNGPLGKYLKQCHRLTAGIDEIALISTMVVLVFFRKMYSYFFSAHRRNE
ncbi:Lipase maturation factor [Caenorhabditis elegans]|nr:Lipase maturation factor [Caenorhabditis elegans]CCD70798.1 Lipase maturation factor [Caenorhabditis elegans]|eukprot:NP_001041273.1 Lipase maturation factor [Caenorhabditis elegans]